MNALLERADLVVLHPDPASFEVFLDAGVGSVTVIDTANVVSGPDLGHAGVGANPGDQGVISLPLDAPEQALELALRRLSNGPPDRVVAACGPNAQPPQLTALDRWLAHGLRPAVDLRHVRWTGDHYLWWTATYGPVELPLDLRSDPPVRVARMLAAATGFVASSGVGELVGMISARHVIPRTTDWDRVLCAQYVGMALRRVCGAVARRTSPELPA